MWIISNRLPWNFIRIFISQNFVLTKLHANAVNGLRRHHFVKYLKHSDARSCASTRFSTYLWSSIYYVSQSQVIGIFGFCWNEKKEEMTWYILLNFVHDIDDQMCETVHECERKVNACLVSTAYIYQFEYSGRTKRHESLLSLVAYYMAFVRVYLCSIYLPSSCVCSILDAFVIYSTSCYFSFYVVICALHSTLTFTHKSRVKVLFRS